MSNKNEHLLRLKKASIEIMSKRGFDVSEEIEVLGYNLSDFEAIYHQVALESIEPDEKGRFNVVRAKLKAAGYVQHREMMSTSYPLLSNPSQHAIVYFIPDVAHLEGKVAKSAGSKSVGTNVASVLKDLIADNTKRIQIIAEIIISARELSPVAAKLLKGSGPEINPLTGEHLTESVLQQIWLDSYLLYNPNLHILTPRHVACTPAEQTAIMNQGTVEPAQHNRISFGDRVAAYNGYCSGQLIRTEQFAVLPTQMTTHQICYRLVSMFPVKRAGAIRNRTNKMMEAAREDLDEK